MKKQLLFFLFGANLPLLCASDALSLCPHGFAAMRGHRDFMEDRHVAIECGGHNIFGLYDGHGGVEAAEFVAKHLHENILAFGEKKAYEQTDAQFLKSPFSSYCGTTAVTAHITPNKKELVVAWAGDSRAVIVKDDGSICFATEDHKPEAPKEKERIETAGGSVQYKGSGPARVNGFLSVARAIGDGAHKKFIISTPDVKSLEIKEDMHYLVLACDGVFDVMENEAVGQSIKKMLDGEVDDIPEPEAWCRLSSGGDQYGKRIAQLIRNKAFSLGSGDNISVLVVLLKELQK